MRMLLSVAVFLLLNGAAASQAASLSTIPSQFDLSGADYQVFRQNIQTTPSPTPQPSPTPTPRPVVTAVIPPTGGILIADDGTTVRLLNGAVLGKTVVSYSRREAGMLPAGPAEMEIRRAFDLSAVDQLMQIPASQFNPPAILAIRHDLDSHADFTEGLALYYHDGRRWATDGITLVGMDNQVVTHTTRHFSSFALMQKRHRIPESSSEIR
jgi:hypothetical protein